MVRGRLDTIALAKSEREKEIIRSLWRAYSGLYNEKYRSEIILDELGKPIDQFKRNIISPDIDFGIAIGQDNNISGNRSIGIGQGAVTKAFLETVMGAYNLIAEGQNPDEWNPVDLLYTLGNGLDAESRSNAIEVFKSGLIRLFNGLKLGEYQHGEIQPTSGTLQFNPTIGFMGHANQKWNKFAFINADAEDGNLTWYDQLTNSLKTSNVNPGEIATLDHIAEIIDDLIEYLEQAITTTRAEAVELLTDHDHEIGNQALLFENNLI